MTSSNYPPDYDASKHLIDDPIEDLEPVDEYDEIEEETVRNHDADILEEVPLSDNFD
mgnify:CR=1 FL=1